jgi:hypothetical protein
MDFERIILPVIWLFVYYTTLNYSFTYILVLCLAFAFFDLFPVELLHTLLTYFYAHEILFSFLNVSDHVDAILLSYATYRMDFQAIKKSHFYLVCRHIR